MAVHRPDKKQRVAPAARDGDSHDAAGVRALADATARISDQSGRLDGEDTHGATAEDAAHWIAVYSELLAFKAELLEITARRRGSMSKDARGEAEADDVVIGAQADKYTRRLREWRAQVANGSPVAPGTPTFAVFVEGRARAFGPLLIDPWKRTVVNHGRPQQLTPGEWQLLRTFLEHPGETLSRAQLAAGVGADGFESPFGQVAVYVSRLRRKLESGNGDPPLIETVRGSGYRLALPLENGDLVAGAT
ncbi:MAG: DNA-binding response regulator [Chloroflexi bacterium]|jgi:DNA-binding winged helix-turn-helix (wHTH) protein|nr:DNA-binding response regulator [Chloroflexota bacterium]